MNIAKTTYPEGYKDTPEHFNNWAREVADKCEQSSRTSPTKQNKIRGTDKSN